MSREEMRNMLMTKIEKVGQSIEDIEYTIVTHPEDRNVAVYVFDAIVEKEVYDFMKSIFPRLTRQEIQ